MELARTVCKISHPQELVGVVMVMVVVVRGVRVLRGGGVGNLGQAVWDIAKYEMWWKKISEIYESPASC